MEFLLDSPVGTLLLGFSGNSLITLRAAQANNKGLPDADKGGGNVYKICDWLSDYFDGKNPSTQDLDIMTRGSAFQERVWTFMKALPYGVCVSYGFLAGQISEGGKGRLLARAVGNAIASNPIWIIIPCHRVIRADGKVGKYGGGWAMKKALLLLEGVDLPSSYIK